MWCLGSRTSSKQHMQTEAPQEQWPIRTKGGSSGKAAQTRSKTASARRHDGHENATGSSSASVERSTASPAEAAAALAATTSRKRASSTRDSLEHLAAICIVEEADIASVPYLKLGAATPLSSRNMLREGRYFKRPMSLTPAFWQTGHAGNCLCGVLRNMSSNTPPEQGRQKVWSHPVRRNTGERDPQEAHTSPASSTPTSAWKDENHLLVLPAPQHIQQLSSSSLPSPPWLLLRPPQHGGGLGETSDNKRCTLRTSPVHVFVCVIACKSTL
mmetsp:Transcript_123290/g.356232  ORF Transcript_123290/g.356232 Transcript_123290/m.356232 type:complete len:272 (+) Transcript_123290:1247-2062(+)